MHFFSGRNSSKLQNQFLFAQNQENNHVYRLLEVITLPLVEADIDTPGIGSSARIALDLHRWHLVLVFL
jgi:hypothetical protein